ncbi:helix-turn-helix domain-containing protein [Pontibacillus sp. HMF3514]|uniref:helix-turn-helix domain-containing protein n=1 Tax=Pontibacillus sp. HMF3514 TaxID=2692425 RepID=UPI00131FEC65|nr:helix-turn-helix domain-containing protein [Pontibacillus sp. HMF3514]QHE51088.1 helix-turn-helix domain-containing protein [Pontibacillus sp. HMF3514]
MPNLDQTRRVLMTFYYSTLVPVGFVENSRQTRIALGELNTPLPIFDDEMNNLFQQHIQTDQQVQLISDSFLRHFILIKMNNHHTMKDGYFWIGPFVYGEVQSSDIEQAFRRRKENVHISKKILSYYKQIPCVEAQQTIYFSHILHALLESNWNTPIFDQTFDQSFGQSQQQLVFPTQTNETQEQLYKYTYRLERSFLEKLKEGDSEAAELVKDIRDVPEPTFGHQDTIRSYKNRLISSITLIARAAIDSGVNEEESLSTSYYYIHETEQKSHLEDLFQLELSIVHDYLSKIQNHNKEHTYLMKACLQKVIDNIHEPVSIESLASELSVRPHQLSSMFKKEVGIPLQQYIHQQKMKEIKKTLLNSEDSILDVANHYGYQSASHFSRLFKKYEGTTPSNYRKQSIDK